MFSTTSLTGAFDLLTMALKHFHLENVFTGWNESLHSHKAYNVFQITITALTSFMTGIGRGYRASVCFIAGTLVMTVTGLMAIEQIKAGDLVLATSPDTYETVYKKVEETYEREMKELLHLKITGAGRTDRIVTTPNHPFYVAGKGFVKAGDLCVGDELCASGAIEKVMVEKILPEVAREPVKVYNLQVEDFHTYHVGALGVWVHNCTLEVKEEGTGAKGLIGHDFEDYLTEKMGGNGPFSVAGREFDGRVGNRWWEAKSGDYWNMLLKNPNKLAKFKSDMGDRLRIAAANGATYELFSNTPIPQVIKQWLIKKGIPFTEILK